MAERWDELTGSWVENPQENGQDNPPENPQEGENSQESGQKNAQEDENDNPPEGEGDNGKKPDKEDADTVIRSERVSKLNKKFIIICFAGVILVFMLIRFIPSAKEKAENAEKQQASEIATPDFGDYAGRAYQGTDIAPVTSYEPIEVIDDSMKSMPQTYQPTQSYQPQQTYQSTQQTPTSVQETTIASRNAPISSGFPWLTAPPTQNNSLASLNGLVNPMMSESEYMQSRLSSLGNMSMGNTGGAYGSGSNGNEANNYESQNMQGNKQGFYTSNTDSMITGSMLFPDTIWEGTIIPAVLITGINTDMPGQIKAMTIENIYDSQTGKTLLIPQGTTLIAEYNSSVSYSQKRVQIAWNTLIRPDGFRLSLGNMTGVDAQGYSGVKGVVNDHFFEYVKAIGIIAAFSAINGEFASTMNLTDNQTAQNIMSGTQGTVNELGTKLIDRALDVQPTITIKSGKTVNIFINRTLSLPPLVAPPVTNRYER